MEGAEIGANVAQKIVRKKNDICNNYYDYVLRMFRNIVLSALREEFILRTRGREILRKLLLSSEC